MTRRLILLAPALLAGLALSSSALAHHRQPQHPSAVTAFEAKAIHDLGCGDGKLVVNVTYLVKNDLDTSVPIANVQYDWATDSYKRHVLVFQTGANTFCAATLSRGVFTTLAGHSPGGTGTIPAGIGGFFFGGYVTKPFHGSLLASPLSPVTGDLGAKDFGCTVLPSHDDATKSCPGTFDWFSQYFTPGSGADFTLARYLFVYQAIGHGTWMDKLSGGTIRTFGDITATQTAAVKAERATS